MAYFNYEGPHGIKITTRVLGGSIPGPTFVVNAGDTMEIEFFNHLEMQPTRNTKINSLRNPDTTNLHWHGAHTSPNQPGDYVLLQVLPGDSFNYTVHLPKHHHPGTHWIHPHFHGSVT
jgi:FtsP/CotA-like multicopper oxidase with cupredoxin domain